LETVIATASSLQLLTPIHQRENSDLALATVRQRDSSGTVECAPLLITGIVSMWLTTLFVTISQYLSTKNMVLRQGNLDKSDENYLSATSWQGVANICGV
jgi:hypothetical protein